VNKKGPKGKEGVHCATRVRRGTLFLILKRVKSEKQGKKNVEEKKDFSQHNKEECTSEET